MTPCTVSCKTEKGESAMCNDQIIITNALNTQKHLTSLYNTAAGECCMRRY